MATIASDPRVIRRAAALAGLGSLSLLLGAVIMQHLLDLTPCALCLIQRWPHAAVVLLAGVAAALARPAPKAAAALVLAAGAVLVAGAAIAAHHVGVEERWWQGITACSGADWSGVGVEEIKGRIMATPVVRCDEVQWRFAGLSMAGWNLLASLSLAAATALLALRRNDSTRTR